MIPLVIFDVVVNVSFLSSKSVRMLNNSGLSNGAFHYATSKLVLLSIVKLNNLPNQELHTFKEDPNSALRIMTIRTFVGSCCTLISSLV